MIENTQYNNILHFEKLLPIKSLFQFSTNKLDGESSDNYASFNLSPFSGDNIDSVNKNRLKLTKILNIDTNHLFTPYQTHSDNVYIIDEAFLLKDKEEQKLLLNGVDAMVTNIKDICIAVSTADCVPILVYDPIKQVLSCIHAGWRSTVAKIASKTIEIMIAKYGSEAADLIVGIGPSISHSNFEVGDEVVEAFHNAHFNLRTISYLNQKTNKTHINLQQANFELLLETGVKINNIEIADLCTFDNDELFFSARRQGIKSGRMLTGGVLR